MFLWERFHPSVMDRHQVRGDDAFAFRHGPDGSVEVQACESEKSGRREPYTQTGRERLEPEVILVVAGVVLIVVGSLFYVAIGETRDAARTTAREAQKQTAMLEQMGRAAGLLPPR
jgi:hypothetical protein